LNMDFNFDNLKRAFEQLKEISFLQRLFSWGRIKSLLIDANGDLQKLTAIVENLKTENSKLGHLLELEKGAAKSLQDSNTHLMAETQVTKKQHEASIVEIATLKESNNSYLKRGRDLANELAMAQQELRNSESNLQLARTQIAQFQKEEEFRRTELSNMMASFGKAQEKIQRDREREVSDRNLAEIERIKKLKETWINHEDHVRNRVKAICSQYTIEYVDKVPFKGKPDNTLKINNEYIIFDAKSPANDDLRNFPSYIKAQVEGGKYVREEDVRREIFLVVPSNTLDYLQQFVHKLSDYTVYIISIDSLEPIILALQRIEDYEFAQQLSPEERENICRVIGKFVHLSKRRIQIDGFFAKQFFELVYRSEADLPKELLDKVVEFEKSEKLNPPIERRARQISVKDLKLDSEKLESEANQRGIITQDSMLSKELNKLPLYTTEDEAARNKDQGNLFGEGA
jgi:hypothetical protein